MHHAEERVRSDLRPAVAVALEAAAVHPGSTAEGVARDKLVEELLDGVVERGFFAMGNLRDALLRNQMKLHDLTSVREFYRGDQIILADRALGERLAGVYRRGEIYLRFFQRASSIFFATPPGRVLTRTLLMPFGGAYLILKGLEHTVGLLLEKTAGVQISFSTPLTRLLLGLLLLGMLNWPAFRASCGRLAYGLAKLLVWALRDAPRWVLRRPWVRALIQSPVTAAVVRYGLEPLSIAAAVWGIIRLRFPAHDARTGSAVAFVIAEALLNSATGRIVERAIIDAVRRAWERLTLVIIADVFAVVMAAFQRLLEWVDRVIYQVDEWLRFRSDQGRGALAAKAAAGFVWFFIAYAARFAINLLIEPQINPLKHVPVVTVSHKIILPNEWILAKAFETLGFRPGRAHAIAVPIIFLIPGVFGFLAWELKENWRLYAANRPRVLRPAMVGSHGETLARLLRPGFHSGTLPRIFARLRRLTRPGPRITAAEESSGGITPANFGRLHHQAELLDHVGQAVRHFFERELVALLARQHYWVQCPVSVGEVRLGVTRIVVDLLCPRLKGGPAELRFEQRSGFLIASLARRGWVDHLPEAEATLIARGLAGVYRMAAVDIVAEQVEAFVGPRHGWDLRAGELITWRHDDPATDHRTPLSHDDDSLRPFAPVGVTWDEWAAAWQTTPPPAIGFEPIRVVATPILPTPARSR